MHVLYYKTRVHAYLTSAAGIKPSSFKPPGSVEQDGGRQSTFTNSKQNILIAVTSGRGVWLALLVWRWGPNQRGGQAFVRFLGLPEWNREMENLQSQRETRRSSQTHAPPAC